MPSQRRIARLRFEAWGGGQPPALAAQYYVALDSSTKQCQVVAQKPDGPTMKMVGSGAYKSEADAEKAIQSLTECNS